MNEIYLLQKQVDMMRMAEKYGVKDWRELVCVRVGQDFYVPIGQVATLFRVHNYKFALAVVEGKAVFEGDELCDAYGRYVKAEKFDGEYLWTDGRAYMLNTYTWNPPKPKTVMVELSVAAAEFYARWIHSEKSLANACRKALENQ